MNNKYLNFLNWAVFTMIDRKTQDDHKSKIQVCGLFRIPVLDEESFLPNLPNPEVKRYLLHVDDLERFEEFYNFIQDLNEKYGDYAIFHVKDGNFTVDEENKFRYMLHIWTDTKIRGVDMF